MLIAVCTTGMIYVGGFFGVDAWGGTDCAGDFIGAFGNTDAFMGLPWGGIIALLFTVIYLVARRVITFKDAMACIPKGFNAMISPILILTLAVSLKATITSLGASIYVHDLMEGAAATLYSMLPAVIFVVACILAFASGTSWGTFAACAPIFLWLNHIVGGNILLTIGAIAGGSCFGDNIGLISDTTIVSSGIQQVEVIKRVRHQGVWSLLCLISGAIVFYIASLGLSGEAAQASDAIAQIPADVWQKLGEERPSAVTLLNLVK